VAAILMHTSVRLAADYDHLPAVNVCNNSTGMLFSVLELQVIIDPDDDMVFERTLNQLMKQVWCNKFMDVCAGEVRSKRLVDSGELGWKEKQEANPCTTMSWMMP